MTTGIITVFVILAIAMVFFLTEWIRSDLVAVLVLVSLTVTGIITPEEALAGLMGANLTLIGASHNLVVDELLRDAGVEPFGFFEFTAIGAVLVVLVLIYTLALGRFLLPEADTEDEGRRKRRNRPRQELVDRYELGDRLWEVWVKPECQAVGERLGDFDIGSRYGLSPIQINRGEQEVAVEDEDEMLQAEDILALLGQRERLDELVADNTGLVVMGQLDGGSEFHWSAFGLIEVVVPPRSPVIGRTLKGLEFRQETGLTCIGLWRDERHHRTDVMNIELEAGDALLLFGAREKVNNFRPASEFLWFHRPREVEAPLELRRLGPLTALIFVSVIVAAALDWLNIAVAALLGAAAVVLIGVMDTKMAYRKVEWRTVVLIGSMYPIGRALEKTGAAGQISEAIVGLTGDWGASGRPGGGGGADDGHDPAAPQRGGGPDRHARRDRGRPSAGHQPQGLRRGGGRGRLEQLPAPHRTPSAAAGSSPGRLLELGLPALWVGSRAARPRCDPGPHPPAVAPLT